MDTLVRLQVSELSKGLVAAWVVTLVRPLAGVLAFVGLQVSELREGAFASIEAADLDRMNVQERKRCPKSATVIDATKSRCQPAQYQCKLILLTRLQGGQKNGNKAQELRGGHTKRQRKEPTAKQPTKECQRKPTGSPAKPNCRIRFCKGKVGQRVARPKEQ